MEVLVCDDVMVVQLRGMLSGDDTSKEQVERQVLHVWDKMYKTWFAKVGLFYLFCCQIFLCSLFLRHPATAGDVCLLVSLTLSSETCQKTSAVTLRSCH